MILVMVYTVCRMSVNSDREYNQVQEGQKDWCVVKWDNGKQSVYPIKAQGLYSLSFVHESF